jgi:hypothetical protein
MRESIQLRQKFIENIRQFRVFFIVKNFSIDIFLIQKSVDHGHYEGFTTWSISISHSIFNIFNISPRKLNQILKIMGAS